MSRAVAAAESIYRRIATDNDPLAEQIRSAGQQLGEHGRDAPLNGLANAIVVDIECASVLLAAIVGPDTAAQYLQRLAGEVSALDDEIDVAHFQYAIRNVVDQGRTRAL